MCESVKDDIHEQVWLQLLCDELDTVTVTISVKDGENNLQLFNIQLSKE